MRDGFIIHEKTLRQMKRLTHDDVGYLLMCMNTFYEEGEIDLDGVAEVSVAVAVILEDAIERMASDAEAYEKSVEQRKKASEKRWKKDANVCEDDANSMRNDASGMREACEGHAKNAVSVSDSVSVSVSEKKKERGARFTPPTPQEVRTYCQERVREGHPAVNPEAFMAFYEANGWRVGKNPMKDWKAAVRTWEQRDKPAREPPKKAYQITGREYDIAALEAQILGRQR